MSCLIFLYEQASDLVVQRDLRVNKQNKGKKKKKKNRKKSKYVSITYQKQRKRNESIVILVNIYMYIYAQVRELCMGMSSNLLVHTYLNA